MLVKPCTYPFLFGTLESTVSLEKDTKLRNLISAGGPKTPLSSNSWASAGWDPGSHGSPFPHGRVTGCTSFLTEGAKPHISPHFHHQQDIWGHNVYGSGPIKLRCRIGGGCNPLGGLDRVALIIPRKTKQTSYGMVLKICLYSSICMDFLKV